MTIDTLSLYILRFFEDIYYYDIIRNIHTGRYVHRTLRVQGVYGYYVVIRDTEQDPADLGYRPVCLI